MIMILISLLIVSTIIIAAVDVAVALYIFCDDDDERMIYKVA